jgi:hypothetical protein
MKKTGLLLVLCVAAVAFAQQPMSSNSAMATDQSTPEGTIATSASFPIEQVATPTASDLYCAGFVNKERLPNADFVAGGLQTPNTTQFVTGDVLYLSGKGYEVGSRYTILRELRDPNRYEMFPGQFAMMKAMGQPYAELARVRVVDTRSKSAVAYVEFSCGNVVPGDIAVPFVEKAMVPSHPPIRFDRFVPANGKVSGRIVTARDFDFELGTGKKVYLNVGANQGVKVGDYFRAVRLYESDLHDSVDSLSFKASTAEDTQTRPPSIDQHMFTKTNGPIIHVADFPRRAVGELVIIGTTPTTSTGMIVFALEDMHIGDGVELDPQ